MKHALLLIVTTCLLFPNTAINAEKIEWPASYQARMLACCRAAYEAKWLDCYSRVRAAGGGRMIGTTTRGPGYTIGLHYKCMRGTW